MLRSCSMAPTVMTFLAVPGAGGGAEPGGSPGRTVVAAKPAVAGGKLIEDRLRAVGAGQGVPHRGVVTGRSGVVFEGAGIGPTVVGNDRVGPAQGDVIVRSRRLLKITVGDQRPDAQVDGQHKETGGGRHAAKIGPRH